MLSPSTLDEAPTSLPGIRVMLVDDHAVVRAGYRRLLEAEPGVRVVSDHASADAACEALERLGGEACGAHGAVRAARAVDVVVLDLSMPGRSGLEALRRMRERWPGVRVLIFTMHDSAAMADQALRAGAAGFITKSSEPALLIEAVRRVAGGDEGVVWVGASQARPRAAGEALAPREFEVMHLLVQGLSVDQIGRLLGLSAKTVSNYQTSVRHKLGAATSIELLRQAQAHGWPLP